MKATILLLGRDATHTGSYFAYIAKDFVLFEGEHFMRVATEVGRQDLIGFLKSKGVTEVFDLTGDEVGDLLVDVSCSLGAAKQAAYWREDKGLDVQLSELLREIEAITEENTRLV